MSTASFPGVNRGRGAKLTPRPLLLQWSSKSKAIPLLPQWAVRPVENLGACKMVHFNFTYTSNPPMWCTACTEPKYLYNGTLYLYLYLYSPYGPYSLYNATLYLYLTFLHSKQVPSHFTSFITHDVYFLDAQIICNKPHNINSTPRPLRYFSLLPASDLHATNKKILHTYVIPPLAILIHFGHILFYFAWWMFQETWSNIYHVFFLHRTVKHRVVKNFLYTCLRPR